MLVLSRKRGEKILIGDDIQVLVTEISGGKVRLGIEAPHTVSIWRPEAKRQSPRPAEAPERPLRILVVDDSPEDRDTYRRIINSDGGRRYLIDEADCGSEGLAWCRSKTPDCLLLDFLLPDLNGLEFLSELSGPSGEIPFPVVMLTGHGDEQVAAQAIKSGADDYLVKRQLTAESLRVAVADAMARAARRVARHLTAPSLETAG